MRKPAPPSFSRQTLPQGPRAPRRPVSLPTGPPGYGCPQGLPGGTQGEQKGDRQLKQSPWRCRGGRGAQLQSPREGQGRGQQGRSVPCRPRGGCWLLGPAAGRPSPSLSQVCPSSPSPLPCLFGPAPQPHYPPVHRPLFTDATPPMGGGGPKLEGVVGNQDVPSEGGGKHKTRLP